MSFLALEGRVEQMGKEVGRARYQFISMTIRKGKFLVRNDKIIVLALDMQLCERLRDTVGPGRLGGVEGDAPSIALKRVKVKSRFPGREEFTMRSEVSCYWILLRTPLSRGR